MNKSVTLLDCTLRDGSHLNKGKFGCQMIRSTIENLVEAKIDIIEVGFLSEERYDTNTAKFKSIADAKRVLPKNKKESHFALMADFINLEELEDADGTIDYIRLSFKRHRLEWALKTAEILHAKGYKCFINPVNCNVYSKDEFIELLKKVNVLNPYGFSIVDTFGVFRKQDLVDIYELTERYLNKEICIGIHLHENLGMAFLLAQHFIEIHNTERKINIDASLLGMGRQPGNLCMEQIIVHMNEQYNAEYQLEPILDVINDYIQPLKNELSWGYAVPYYLSAKHRLHRTYAEYLMNKWKLGTKDIERILSKVDKTEAENFNEPYIEKLYNSYIRVKIDDADDIRKLKGIIEDKKILLIAPGVSINEYKETIINMAKTCITISIGFIPDFCDVDFIWLSTQKRYNQYQKGNGREKVIITSNLLHDYRAYDFALNYEDLIFHGEIESDNSTLMAIKFLKNLGKKDLCIAGFDGFTGNQNDFYGEIVNREKRKEDLNIQISTILKNTYQNINFNFITPTKYI